jgi:hypothetical protein
MAFPTCLHAQRLMHSDGQEDEALLKAVGFQDTDKPRIWATAQEELN